MSDLTKLFLYEIGDICVTFIELILIPLKKTIFIFFFLYSALTVTAQKNLYLQVSAAEKELAAIDSVGYAKTHVNAKSVVDEANALSEKLKRIGYIENEILDNTKTNDSTFLFTFALGKKTKSIHIYIGANAQAKALAFPNEKKDTLTIPFAETEAFLNRTLNTLETQGYSLSNLHLANLRQQNGRLYAQLNIETGKRRQVNDIVIVGYDKFPEGHKRNVKRLYRNKTFSQETLRNINADFQKFRFVNQTKYPEILFKSDTTKVYVYLEKAKPNRFDGYIGFSNDEENGGGSKVNFNGYLDLLLVNFLNVGEEFTLYWKSDGNDQKTFNAGIELPYIFRSPFGLKASLNIFKQDSTFQNTRTAIGLGYFFNYNTRLYLGYEATESSDIQNLNSASISDYKNAFATTTFEFTEFRNEDFLFPEKTRIILKAGLGSRKSKLDSNSQVFGDISLMHNIYLNEKNSLNLKSHNYYLQSDKYIISELFRFGGINSIRGFNENSLQANLLTSLLTEYRYVLAPGIYVHSIIDYGYFRDESANLATANSGSLLGLGFGFGLLTKNGLFNIVYANGTTGDQAIKLSNSIVHISFKATF